MPFQIPSAELARWLHALIAAAVFLSVSASTIAASPRVALVIGNAAYPGPGALRNPANDANDIAEKLKRFGFDVMVRTDIGHKEMLRALTEFGGKVQPGIEALFFYAGHGMQVRGKNYLIPIDAEIRSEASVSSEAVDVDQLLDKLSPARLSMVILDACRNNPFERRFRGGGQGLAQINAPTGTLIAYATAPGKVAADGDGRNGLYTAELLVAMDAPGVKVEDVFKRVRGNVVKRTGDAQTPWESSSLTGDFYFVFQGPTTVHVQSPMADPESEVWRAAESANTLSSYQAYIDAYPKGRYVVAAKIKLDALQKPAVMPSSQAAILPVPTSVVRSATSDDPESQLWNEVKASGAREYFDAYLKQYPKGKYVALARIELKQIDERDKAQKVREVAEKQQAAERERQESARNEQQAWDQAKSGGNAAGYASYLERYSKGRYAALAQAALQKLQREAVEREKNEPKRAMVEARPGKTFKDCADCPDMVVVPAGSFEMGSSNGDKDERPVHNVRISSAFAMGKTEVTQRQWRAIMGNNSSHFSNCGDNCPVEQLTLSEAQEFVRRLSQKTGKTYRLPSEAEWEYTCRAGGIHAYCGDETIDNVAWNTANSGAKSHPVGGKQPNAWGFYDMSGNVWEWTEDCWNGNYNGAPSDGSVWSTGDCGARVLRGGSWGFKPQFARAAKRGRVGASARFNDAGLRLVRVLP